MENTHKELSDKEIALELTKLAITPKNSAINTNDAKVVAEAYNLILKTISTDKDAQ